MTTTEIMQKAEEYQPLEYRVFRNEEGRYQAQRKYISEYPSEHELYYEIWDTITTDYSRFFGPSMRWDYPSVDYAERVCRAYAAHHKAEWIKYQRRGVVRHLGKLP